MNLGFAKRTLIEALVKTKLILAIVLAALSGSAVEMIVCCHVAASEKAADPQPEQCVCLCHSPAASPSSMASPATTPSVSPASVHYMDPAAQSFIAQVFRPPKFLS